MLHVHRRARGARLADLERAAAAALGWGDGDAVGGDDAAGRKAKKKAKKASKKRSREEV